MTKVAILGDGLTGQSIKKALERLRGYSLTEVQYADLIVTSPGIPAEKMPKTSVEIISEIEFAYRLFHRPGSPYRPKLIAVTGTNGKTTVTSLISHLLGMPAAGNIGTPLIDYVDSPSRPEWLVVELSSYQLEFCTTFRPEIAVLTNITPDHLLRHKTMENYACQKAKIFGQQRPSDTLIYFNEDTYVSDCVSRAQAMLQPYSLKSPELSLLTNSKLVGNHNQLNMLAGLYAAKAAGLDMDLILSRLATFTPVEHRLEFVRNYHNRPFYNDSKATNPDSTLVAVDAFTDPIHLILCGQDKQLPLEVFIGYLHKKVKTITIFGDISERFVAGSKKQNASFPLFQVQDIDAAIRTAFKHSKENDIILFSPSCASFDQFKDYNHRGQVFKEQVNLLS